MLSAGPEGKYDRAQCATCQLVFWSPSPGSSCRKCTLNASTTQMPHHSRAGIPASFLVSLRSHAATRETISPAPRNRRLTRPQIDAIQARDSLSAEDLQLLSMHFSQEEMDSEEHNRVSTPQGDASMSPLSQSASIWRRTARGWREGAPRLEESDLEHLPAPLESNTSWVGQICAICLSDMRLGEDVRALSACCHIFHGECIQPWLRRRAACPICRGDES